MALPNSAQDAGKLRWLFLDLNSYFASVEQQERPELRGKPIIVTPVDSDRTCAIAASYEAKAFGIRTGTLVREAKRLCPGLKTVNARHDFYVEYHHKIADEIERHLHITKAHSIDEVACELLGAERQTKNALALAQEVQQGILKNVGECLRSSIGLGPSVLLAKTASDMKKPGGITVLGADKLPGPLLGLDLQDLCGVGRRMDRRLREAGINDVAALWALTPSRARSLWGSIAGERFWYALHGTDPPEIATERHSISHSHVLGPALRNVEASYLVARRLLARAVSRLRRAEHKAGGLSLWLGMRDKQYREAAMRLPATADTFRLLDALDALWRDTVRPQEQFYVLQVGVVLHGLTPLSAIVPDLFAWTSDENENAKHSNLSTAIDRLNQKYGSETVSIGVAPTGLPGYMGAKIAFNRIPDRKDFAG